jgi:hypothetical protein
MDALRRLIVLVAAMVMTLLQTIPAVADAAAPPRIEARSASMMAVGIVHGDRMSIRISRLQDNAPVHDAALTVLLRGTAHPTVAQTDGSYTLQTKDLEVPGTAAIVFQVTVGAEREDLKGEVAVAADQEPTQDKNGARQLGWWVLNFAVCIGFLMLLSRRRKAAKDVES